jgi:hypothetical protein
MLEKDTKEDKNVIAIWVDADPRIARERVVQRDLAAGADGGTIESITEFADWWDSLLTPLYMEEDPWKYSDVVISGTQSDLNSGNIKINIPK